MLEIETRLRVADSVAAVESEGATYVLVLGSPEMQSPLVLRNTALLIWRQIDGSASAQQIADIVSAEANLPAEDVMPDVCDFLTDLYDAKLVSVVA